MAGLADDVIDGLNAKSLRRLDFEKSWRQVARVAAPDMEIGTCWSASSAAWGLMPTATATARSKDIYDATAVTAVDRLASGLEALIIPQSDYWHGFEIHDLSREEATDDEKLWMERLRNLLFKVRYDADTGWIAASQAALRRLVAFGNAFLFVEDGLGGKSLTRYRLLPLGGCYADENHQGIIDSFDYHYTLTARQAYQKFGDKVSEKIRKLAEDPKSKDRSFQFVQSIRPRAEYGMSRSVMDAPWASCHVDIEHKHVVTESGFYEFPIVDFRWLPEPGKVYGEGPVQRCLADIQSLNIMAKNEMTASQQAIDPPMLIANAGVIQGSRPNTNPGASNMGGLGPTGEPLIKPMFTGQRLDFSMKVLEAKRMQVKESLYINLFALLVDTPQMTATQAIIRANEKGELLGPAGARVQQSLSGMVEREVGILERKGLFDRDSAYVPPRSMGGANIGPQFAGPISRLRRMKEAEGTMRLLQVMSPLAQVEPEVTDNLDGDEMTRELADIFGAPRKIVRSREAVAERRAQRQQAQSAMQNAQIASEAANAAKVGGEALAAFGAM